MLLANRTERLLGQEKALLVAFREMFIGVEVGGLAVNVRLMVAHGIHKLCRVHDEWQTC